MVRDYLSASSGVLTALYLLGLFSPPIYDSDFWWHLRTGQYIVENHTLPVPDPFAWTTANAGEARTRHFNLTHEWLAQVLFYAVWRAGGFGAIVALRALSMTAACALTGLILWRRRQSFYLAIAAAIVSASVIYGFALDRPYQITLLFFTATLAILEFRGPLWLLPAIFFVWANAHGGYFLGFVVLGAFCAEPIVRRRRDWKLWTVTAACFAAAALNPNGLGIFRALLDYRASYMTSRLLEWARPQLWPASPFSILLVATAAVLLWQYREVRIADWLLFAAFAAAALTAQRNIVFIGFLAPVLIGAYVPWTWRFPALLRYAVPAAALAAIAAGIIQGGFYQFRAAEWKYPRGAADFLLAHHIGGPLFNTYEHGGYLIWRLYPAQRVFIDGRSLSESLFMDYARILYNHDDNDGQPSGDQLLDRYGIQTIVMNTFEPATGNVYVLAPALADPSQTTWKLVYNDAQSVIFMRTPPPGVEPLNSLEVLTHMESECALHLDNEPEYLLCARSLGEVFAKVGDPARARRWLATYLGH